MRKASRYHPPIVEKSQNTTFSSMLTNLKDTNNISSVGSVPGSATNGLDPDGMAFRLHKIPL
jgi:hypothetical protein